MWQKYVNSEFMGTCLADESEISASTNNLTA